MELGTLEPDPGNAGGGKSERAINPPEFPGRIFFSSLFLAKEIFMEQTKQPEASLAIQVLPKTAGGDEVIRIVDAVISYLKSTGLPVFVGPFETTLEGDFDRLWEIAGECQRICLREGAQGVSAYIKTAYNPNARGWSIEKKVAKHHG
jgi:uncharacterized protein YqgV (UPF0045/DUF77 family)